MSDLTARVKALETKKMIEDMKVVLYDVWGEGEPVERTSEGVTTVITWEEWLSIKNDDVIDVVTMI